MCGGAADRASAERLRAEAASLNRPLPLAFAEQVESAADNARAIFGGRDWRAAPQLRPRGAGAAGCTERQPQLVHAAGGSAEAAGGLRQMWVGLHSGGAAGPAAAAASGAAHEGLVAATCASRVAVLTVADATICGFSIV